MSSEKNEPGPGRSTAEAAFNEIKRDIAQRNEQAHKNALKLRLERDRKQALLRRQQDLR
ncbi:MAG TPA: hypothetical protein VG294_02165 [Solirubrobacteraceae bacterium]|jgi:hypothetical protein|nr:hypothetical protein [Solirubrobacteraceae bacterium]